MDNLNNEILIVKGQIKELLTLKNYVDSRCNSLEQHLQNLLADRTSLKNKPLSADNKYSSIERDRSTSPSPRHASP